MALTISDSLKKQIEDFYSSLTERDIQMLGEGTKSLTKMLRAMAEKQPTGSLAGRWEDRRGIAPNEVESDDSNP